MPIARPASGCVHEAAIYRRVPSRKLQRRSAFDVISTREFYFDLVEMRFAQLVRKQSCVSHAIRCRLSWLSVAAPDFFSYRLPVSSNSIVTSILEGDLLLSTVHIAFIRMEDSFNHESFSYRAANNITHPTNR